MTSESCPSRGKQGPCHFKVKSCSMFNKDYEVYKEEVDKDKLRLFLNKEGKAFSDKAYIDLENYIREDEENPKKGQCSRLPSTTSTPDSHSEYGSDSSDGFSSDGFRPSRRKLQMRWRLSTKATLKAEAPRFGVQDQGEGEGHGAAHRPLHPRRGGQPSEALPRLRARQEDLVQDQEQADRRYHR